MINYGGAPVGAPLFLRLFIGLFETAILLLL